MNFLFRPFAFQFWPLLAGVIALASTSGAVATPSPEERAYEQRLAGVVPSERQYRWQRTHAVYGFIHFGINTFTDREWGTGKESPRLFNPTALDARQWARTFKEAGMSMVIFTAKHHDGFCLWPSRYTEHSVKNSPWKNGQGNVVREVVDACRAEGLAVGVYLSPADLFQIENRDGYYGDGSPYVESTIPTDPVSFKKNPSQGRPVPFGAPVFKYQADSYNRYFLNQLYELLTEYGPIDEVWFDGAHPKRKGDQRYTSQDWFELIRTLQPDAVIAIGGPDVRWVGNEKGIARESEWSVVGLPKKRTAPDAPLEGHTLGDRDALRQAVDFHWHPAEADVSIRPGWFYHAKQDNRVKSAATLMDLYVKSVGRNATLLLNVPPDKRGLFHENDVRSLREFGKLRRETYGKNLATGANVTAGSFANGTTPAAAVDGNYDTFWAAEPWTTPVTLDITLPKPVTFNRIVLQEQIKQGQRVEQFTVEAKINDTWHALARATTIGYQRILPVNETTTSQLRVRFDAARVAPTLAEFGLYRQAGEFPRPVLARSPDGTVRLAALSWEWVQRYTTEGSKPTAKSREYKGPVSLPEGGVFTVGVFRRKDNKPGETATAEFGYAKNSLKIVAGLQNDTAAALDENDGTFASNAAAETIVIDLGETKTVSGLTYLPRQDGKTAGIIENYAVHISDAPAIKNTAIKTGRFDNIRNNPVEQVIRFEQPVQTRYLILAPTGVIDGPGVTAAELGVLGK